MTLMQLQGSLRVHMQFCTQTQTHSEFWQHRQRPAEIGDHKCRPRSLSTAGQIRSIVAITAALLIVTIARQSP